MATIKEGVAKVTNNAIGALAGAGIAFFAAKKFGKVQNKWALAGITIVGIFAGALAQSKIKASKSKPNAATVKSSPKK